MRELRVGDAVVAEIVRTTGRIEQQVARAQATLDDLAVLHPAGGDRPVQHEVNVLDVADVGLHGNALRQVDHVHAIAVRRRAALADIGEAREARLVPDRRAVAVANDVLGQLLVAPVGAVGREQVDLLGARGAEAARQLEILVLGMADMDRHLGRAAADRDLHQDRLDAVIAEAVRPTALVEQQVAGPELHLDHLVAPHRAHRQDALQDEEMLDDLVGVRARELADRLVDQAEGEVLGLQRRRIVRLGRSAGADIAQLGAQQIGEAPAGGKGVPVERLLGEQARIGAHLAREGAGLLR